MVNIVLLAAAPIVVVLVVYLALKPEPQKTQLNRHSRHTWVGSFLWLLLKTPFLIVGYAALAAFHALGRSNATIEGQAAGVGSLVSHRGLSFDLDEHGSFADSSKKQNEPALPPREIQEQIIARRVEQNRCPPARKRAS